MQLVIGTQCIYSHPGLSSCSGLGWFHYRSRGSKGVLRYDDLVITAADLGDFLLKPAKGLQGAHTGNMYPHTS